MSFQNNILQLHTNYNFTDYIEFYTSFLKLTWHITATAAAIINIIVNTTIIAWEIQQRNDFGYFNYLAYLIPLLLHIKSYIWHIRHQCGAKKTFLKQTKPCLRTEKKINWFGLYNLVFLWAYLEKRKVTSARKSFFFFTTL